MGSKKTAFVIYYSMYGHVEQLARQAVKGLEKSGVNAKLYQVPEVLPQEVLKLMHAPPKPSDVPIITAAELPKADGFLFGMPTRFGMVPAQMKSFFDSCGRVWLNGEVHHKFAGTFFSTGSLGAGQETTAYSTLPFFTHLGMVYVPLGSKGRKEAEPGEQAGGSMWGAGTFAGDGSRQPTPYELEIANFQGSEFGNLLNKLK